MTVILSDCVVPLEPGQLSTLAGRIRRFLVEKVCAAGGHLGPNLGVVELSIALHRVFDSPRDVIVFDTGHQASPHKILTGRAGEFGTLRQAHGLSGYPSRCESPAATRSCARAGLDAAGITATVLNRLQRPPHTTSEQAA